MTRRLCIAVHDVAPATWPACAQLVAMVDALGAPPLTLLVVPDWHGRGAVDADAPFRRAIDARLARGDEVALHGYRHLDEAVPPRSPLQWLRRRVLTAGEGEFAALDHREAVRRLDAGRRRLAACGWSARGFVAPAWLLGDAARRALAAPAFAWTSTHAGFDDLDAGTHLPAPVISASARSGWRRHASQSWLGFAARAYSVRPLLRIALHPSDAAHPALLDAWRRLLLDLLPQREALTKSAAIAGGRAEAARAARATPAHRAGPATASR